MPNRQLQAVIAQLRVAAGPDSDLLLARQLDVAARPFAPVVRAAILNTPSKGTVPWPPQVPGLRLRIARCVRTWATVRGNLISVGIEMDPSRMPDGQKSLPLMLNGDKRWRHPVFGEWLSGQADQPSWPYFDRNVAALGPASARAVERAVDLIAKKVEG